MISNDIRAKAQKAAQDEIIEYSWKHGVSLEDAAIFQAEWWQRRIERVSHHIPVILSILHGDEVRYRNSPKWCVYVDDPYNSAEPVKLKDSAFVCLHYYWMATLQELIDDN